MTQNSFSDHDGVNIEIKKRSIFLECLKYLRIKNFNQPSGQEREYKEN